MLHRVGEIKAGIARFHALLQVGLRSFVKTLDVSRIFTHSRCSHICFSSKTAFQTNEYFA